MSAYRSLLTVLLSVSALTLASAQDAKAIIQKAIEAAGYPKDNKTCHETWDEKGKMTLFGQSMPYDSKWYFEAPDKFRFDMKMNMQGQNMELVFLQNGKQAKQSMMGQTQMLEGEKLAETQHSCYQLWVLSLRPLVHDAGFKLTALGESKFYDKDVVSVKVQREGQRDITLHFDKKTNLLAGCTDMAKDEFQEWKEVKQESVLGDYAKGADGEMKYTSMKVYRDGTILLQSKFSNSKRSDKLQPDVFKLD